MLFRGDSKAAWLSTALAVALLLTVSGVAKAQSGGPALHFDAKAGIVGHTSLPNPALGAAATPERARPRASTECFGVAATIVGTPGPNVLTGTPGDDVIVGLGGRDIIRGGDGYDTICGGTGNDDLHGEGGGDAVIGEGGNDLIKGGPGAGGVLVGDYLQPGATLENRTPGRDRLFLGPDGGGASTGLIGDNAGIGNATGGAADTITVGPMTSGYSEYVVGDSFSQTGSARGGGKDVFKVDSRASLVLLIGDSLANLQSSGQGADRITAPGPNGFTIGDSAALTGSAYGGGRDRVVSGSGVIVGDSFQQGVGGTVKGGGKDSIRAVKRPGSDPGVIGDSRGMGTVRGGGNDTITNPDNGLSIGDSYSLDAGASVQGGGNDLIKATGSGGVIADSGSTAGDASGGGNDRVTVSAPAASNPNIVGDSYASGTARGGGRDILRGGAESDDAYGDSLAVSGNALLSGDDKIFTGKGDDFIYGDGFSDLGISRGGGDDLIRAGGGADEIHGDHPGSGDIGAGRDRLFGDTGLDFLDGGPLRDFCDGGPDSPDTHTACEVRLRFP